MGTGDSRVGAVDTAAVAEDITHPGLAILPPAAAAATVAPGGGEVAVKELASAAPGAATAGDPCVLNLR
jgi:hypothetical protein